MDLDLKPRRIITGHNREGKAVIIEDEVLVAPVFEPGNAGGDRRVAGVEIWGTATSPVSNADELMESQKKGWAGHTEEGKGQRTMIRIGKLPPGHVAPMHRTESIDYAILLEGECDLLLDSGEKTTVHAGDIIIQRGTMHSWMNRSDKTATWLFVLIDAEPVRCGDNELTRFMGEAPDVSQFYP